jgi:hypothetical protein
LQLLRPLSIEPQSFQASRLNLGERVDLALFLGKRNLKVSLWKAVHDCAKSGCRIASRAGLFRFPAKGSTTVVEPSALPTKWR